MRVITISSPWNLALHSASDGDSVCELSGDTTIDTADLAILAENWLSIAP